MKVSRSSRHRVMKTQMKILKIIEKMVTIQSIKSKQQHIFNHSLICFSEIVDHRYLCLKKLGWGHFSTVWLALKLQEK